MILALVSAGLVLGLTAPDVPLLDDAGAAVGVGSFRGSFTALVLGMDARADDAVLVKALLEVKPPSGTLRVVPVSFVKAPEAKPQAPGTALPGQRHYFGDAGAFQALGAWENGQPMRLMLLLNPSGKLIRVFPTLERLPELLQSWLAGSSLSPRTIGADPRPLFKLQREPGEKGLLVLFLSTKGSVDALYAERIAKLAGPAAGAKVTVIGVFSEYDETAESVAAFAKLHAFEFPCVRDEGAAVADLYRATRTPEVFLLNASLEVVYTGAVDSSTWEDDSTRRHLREAMDAMASGKKPQIASTLPFGTLLRRNAADERAMVR